MKNIYPNFYDVIPMPTEDGFIILRCPHCHETWLVRYQDVKEKETVCPYCGQKNQVDNFFHEAYQDAFNYFHMISLKNLLSLISVEIEITENETDDDKLRYQVNFLNVSNPSEEQMEDYVTMAYETLKKKAEDRTLELETKVPILIQDVVNIDEYVDMKMTCCDKLLKVKENKQDIKYCMFCKPE